MQLENLHNMTKFLVVRKTRVRGRIFHPFEYAVSEYEFENLQQLLDSLNASLDNEYIIVEKSHTLTVKPHITYNIVKEEEDAAER